jgi:hypothetical protein
MQEAEQVEPGAEQAEPGGEPDVFTVQGARAKMNMPKDLQAAYVRIVEAGMKVMFDPQTRGQTIAAMEEPGDMATKLGDGVAAVMALLFKESNKTMPPQLIIPCGVELLLHAAAVAKSGGMEIDNNTMAEAMAIMIEKVMQTSGVDAAAGGMIAGGDPGQGAQQGAPAGAPGIVQGAMQ